MRITYNYTEYPHSPRATRASLQNGVCGGPTQIIVGFMACAGGYGHDDFMIIGILGYLFIRVFRIFCQAKEVVYAIVDQEQSSNKIAEQKLIGNYFKEELKTHIFYILALPAAVITQRIGYSMDNIYLTTGAYVVYAAFKVLNLLLLKFKWKIEN